MYKREKGEAKEERMEKKEKSKIKKVKRHLKEDMQTFSKEKKDDKKLLAKLNKKR